MLLLNHVAPFRNRVGLLARLRLISRLSFMIVAPRWVLLRYAQDQILDGFVGPRSPDRLPKLRAIKLASHQLAEPAKDGIGPGSHCDFGQCLAPEPVGDLGQRALLSV